MGLREEVLDMKKEVNEVKEQSLAMELVKGYKVANVRMFVICILLIIFAGVIVIDDLRLRSDIGTVTTTKTQEITDVETIENSTIQNEVN